MALVLSAVLGGPAAEGVAPHAGTDFHLVLRSSGAEYSSVSCVRVGLCLAVGTGSAAFLSNGRWRTVTGGAPNRMDARSVSCVEDGTCMATGPDRDLLYTLQPGRLTWREVDIPPARGADGSRQRNPGNSVDCIRPNWCMAVGFEVTRSGSDAVAISVWNGRQWNAHLHSAGRGRDIDGQHVSCWAVGRCEITAFSLADFPIVVQAHVLNWSHGGVTDTQPFGARSDTSDFPYIACTSADHCLALGSWSATGIRHLRQQTAVWNGTTWRRRASHYVGPPAEQFEPSSVSCLQPDLCVAAGVWPSGLPSTGIEVWAHGRWTRRSLDAVQEHTDNTLEDVTCPTARDCLAVGAYATRTTVVGYVEAGRI